MSEIAGLKLSPAHPSMYAEQDASFVSYVTIPNWTRS